MSRWLIILLSLLTTFRLVLAWLWEIGSEEALVWRCSSESQLHFMNFGPLAPIVAQQGVWGRTLLLLAVFGLQFPLWHWVVSLHSRRAATWCVILLQLVPLTGLGAIFISPAGLACLGWMTGLMALWMALHRARWALGWWSLVAVSWALATASHPSAWLAGPCLIGLLTLPRRWRGQWKKPGLWLALIGASVGPALWSRWQQQHQWLIADQQFQALALSGRHGLRWMGQVAMALSPVVALGVAWLLASALITMVGRLLSRRQWRQHISTMQERWPWLRWGHVEDADLFLGAFALPSLLCCVILGFLEGCSAMIIAPAATTALVWLVIHWQNPPARLATARLCQQAALTFAGLYSLAFACPDLLRHWGLVWPAQLDPTTPQVGWQTTSQNLSDIWQAQNFSAPPDHALPLIAEDAELAALLQINRPRSAPTNLPAFQPIFTPRWESDYTLWNRWDKTQAGTQSPYRDQSTFYIQTGQPTQRPPEELRRWFKSWEPIACLDVIRGGRTLRRLTVFRMEDFTPPPP